MKLHYRCRDCKYYWEECYTMRGRRSCSYVCKNFWNKDINKTLEEIKAEINAYLQAEGFGSEYRNDVVQIIDKHIGKEGAV